MLNYQRVNLPATSSQDLVKSQKHPAISAAYQPRGNSTPRKDQRRSREAGTNCWECDSLGDSHPDLALVYGG